jgi:hypothetical protein
LLERRCSAGGNRSTGTCKPFSSRCGTDSRVIWRRIRSQRRFGPGNRELVSRCVQCSIKRFDGRTVGKEHAVASAFASCYDRGPRGLLPFD